MRAPIGAGRRGSIANTAMFLLPAMLGMVSMGVDWGQVSVAQFALRAATDEASLAAASALSSKPKTAEEIAAAQTKAESIAASMVKKMSVNGLSFKVEKISFGYYDKASGTKFTTTIPSDRWPNAAAVTVSTSVDMSFAALFGVNDVTVRRTSKSGAGIVPKRAADLVIVQDLTGTMSAGDIANSKIANKALVDCIQTKSDKETRGAMVKWQNTASVVQPLKSYKEAPSALYNAVAGTSPSTAYNGNGLCLGSGGGCTTHASGLYTAVDVLNNATEPPDGIGQAVVIITDGAPWANNTQCTAIPNASGSAYQKWMVGDANSRCGQVKAQTTQVACENVGGRWGGNSCYPGDNGAEGTATAGKGTCSLGSSYTTEARCEGDNGKWYRTGTTTLNPTSLTRWVDDVKAEAVAGKWGPIDVYAVFYSDNATATYKKDNFAHMTKHMLTGKGAELGVLDAPGGAGLVTALQSLCEAYTMPAPGLIE